MRLSSIRVLTPVLALLSAPTLNAQQLILSDPPDPAVASLVDRLDLERYKATIKGLTQFGDRRQGTARNRAAVDWIEAQLKSYGCTPTERLTYQWQPAPPRERITIGPNQAVGGGTLRGHRRSTRVNLDSLKQPDLRLRALNAPPTVPGERQEVYCTKVGTEHPDEMYIVGGHMDGIGWGEAANDDGSGTAIVMELARIFSDPTVHTSRSIRFILWNNEESGLDGAAAYVAQRRDLQGKESPAGSGKYPEPKWLGMIQHDRMMFDHGMPRADSTVSRELRPEVVAGTAEKYREAYRRLVGRPLEYLQCGWPASTSPSSRPSTTPRGWRSVEACTTSASRP